MTDADDKKVWTGTGPGRACGGKNAGQAGGECDGQGWDRYPDDEECRAKLEQYIRDQEEALKQTCPSGAQIYPQATCGLVDYPRPEAGPFESLGREIGALVDKKNRAYGDSFARAGEFLRILYPNGIRPAQYDDMLGIVRIFDKFMRIATNNDPMGEDPREDIVGYGLLMQGLRRKDSDRETEKKPC